MRFPGRKVLTIWLLLILNVSVSGRPAADATGQCAKPLAISNFRRIAADQIGDQFAWGNESQLFYVRQHPSGKFIYLWNLRTSQTALITKGVSPAFQKFPDHDALFFMRENGYGIDRELWCFLSYPRNEVEGESKWSSATLSIQDDIYLNPADSRSFVYPFSCTGACGDFEQIRYAHLGSYGDSSAQVYVLFSRQSGGPLFISGWLDNDTILCFIQEEPHRLKVSFNVPALRQFTPSPDWAHYPEEHGNLLVRGLEGIERVALPRSNFSPDGRSYLVYSPTRKSIVQKDIHGKDLSSTVLPDSVHYFSSKQPVFSPDGRHIAFIGLINPNNGTRAIYLADVD